MTRTDDNEPASVTRPGPNYRWWVVFMLWFICFFNYADRQSIFSIFPKLEHEFGFSKVELGLIASAFMWMYAAGAPIAGYLADRLRRKDLILGGCLVWSAFTVSTAWCGKLAQFVAVRALEGLGETVYFPASMSLISDYHDGKTRSRAMSYHLSSVYIGTIAGTFLGAWFAEHTGWRFGFYVFGGCGVLLSLVLLKTLREPPRGGARIVEIDSPEIVVGEVVPRNATTPPTDIVERGIIPGSRRETFAAALRIFSVPTVLSLMIVFMLANFVASIFLTWMPTFLVEKFHLSLVKAGLGSAGIQLASALSMPLAGLLADRFSARRAGGRMIVQAIGLFGGAGLVYAVGATTTLPALLCVMIAYGFCKGFYDSGIFASLYDVIEPRSRGTAAGIMNTAGWGGGALGPLAVGYVTQHGRHTSQMANMSEAISFGSVLYLVGASILLLAIFAFAARDRARLATAYPAAFFQGDR
jgi:MFS family permease